MAVQKLHEFCEAEKRKIFALRKLIVHGKTLIQKYIYDIEISLNTSFFKELIPKQQRKKHVH